MWCGGYWPKPPRSLIVVVRDAHRHLVAAQVADMLLAARPDAILVEMGLPAWRPETTGNVASFGAARNNARAAAEVLGLIGQREPAQRGGLSADKVENPPG
jgi:hypothetical protein